MIYAEYKLEIELELNANMIIMSYFNFFATNRVIYLLYMYTCNMLAFDEAETRVYMYAHLSKINRN